MSHEIETHGTQAAAIFARQDAWHHLGTVVSDAFTAEDAMTLGHLGGWNVRKVALTASELTTDGVDVINVPDHFATVRTNPFTGQPETLGVVGTKYRPIQNEEHADVLNTLVDESGAIFETAGSLRGGRQVFVTMKLPQHISVAGVDNIEVNLAALNSHDGTGSFRLLVTPTRIVCANTQAAAMRDARASYAIRHTSSANARIQAAREALGMTTAYVEAFEAQAEQMIQQTMTDAEFHRLTVDLFGDPTQAETKRSARTLRDRADTLTSLWADASTQKNIRGTRWAGLQSVVEYLDHYAPARGQDKATSRAERVLTSGDLERTKHRAWQLCTA